MTEPNFIEEAKKVLDRDDLALALVKMYRQGYDKGYDFGFEEGAQRGWQDIWDADNEKD